MTPPELAAGPPLDIAIIGGGINGCAIAAEAARRGYRTALFEADDFGFGTTWRSTKLIHGGLRYLEHGDIRLVAESLRERAWLLRAKPHLVRPQRFILPLLPWTRRPAWQLRAGLALYDALALGGGVPGHRRVAAAELRTLAPYLGEVAGGAFLFYDARALAPERLALELALLAERRGAFIANHTPVTRILAPEGRVRAIEVQQGAEATLIACHRVVNAAGPWVDAVNALGDLPPPRFVGATRGSHIALELDLPLPQDAVFSFAREDGRVFFAVPQDELLLVGTTDTRYDDAPSAVRPTAEDVAYLLAEAQELLPGFGIEAAHVRYAYSGLRPLQRVAGGPEAAISRGHSVLRHERFGGAAGLLSVVGGKLSTFRPLAKDVLGALELEEPGPPLARPRAPSGQREDWREVLRGAGLDARTTRRLAHYGPVAPAVLEAGREQLCDACGLLLGDVRYTVAAEHALTPGDVLLRRSGAGWLPGRGLCCFERVTDELARLCGWNAAVRAQQASAYRREVAYHLPVPAELRAGAGVSSV